MVFEKVREIIAEKLGIDRDTIAEDSSLNDMQIDSLYMVEIMLSLEDEFGVMIEDASGIETVADLCHYVEKQMA